MQLRIHIPRRRALSILAACGVALILTILSLWLRFNRSLNFLAYQPNKVPAGIIVTSHTVTVAQGEDGAYDKMVRYITNTTDFAIAEEKSTPAAYSSGLFTCAFHPVNSTCQSYTSPAHQTYLVQTTSFQPSTDSNTEQIISWLKGNTLAWIDLTRNQATRYAPFAWGPIIDAFTPIHYNCEDIQHTSWSGV